MDTSLATAIGMVFGITLFVMALPVNATLQDNVTAPQINVSQDNTIIPSNESIGRSSNVSAITVTDSMHPYYVWIDPHAVDLTGANPEVFQNSMFLKEPGGILSSSLFTPSVSDFLKADLNAGHSLVNKKAAKVGLVNLAN